VRRRSGTGGRSPIPGRGQVGGSKVLADMTSPSTSRRAGVALGSLVLGYLLIGLIAGAPDSPLVPPFPAGVRAPGWTTTGSRWLGLDRLSRTGLTVVSIVLLAAIVIAFLLVLAEARRGRVRLAPVLATAGLSLALSIAAPVLLSRDVYSYAIYGRIYSVHHANPYVSSPSAFPIDPFVAVASPAWVNTKSVYGPAFVLTGAGVTRVWAGSPGATILAFKVLAGMGAALATVFAARAGRSVGKAAMAAAAVGLNPVIVVHAVGGGHNDALIAACLAGALVLGLRWLGRTEKWSETAVLGITGLLTLAGLIKVIVFPVLLVWLWLLVRASFPGRRPFRGAFHAAAAASLCLAMAAPFMTSFRALGSLVTLASVEGWASPARLVARGARALGNVIGGSATAEVLAKIVVIGFFAVFAAAMVRFLRRLNRDGAAVTSDRLADTWGACALGLVLAIPYVLPWYAAWFLPFIALMSERGLAMIGFAAAGLLALTGVPAEPGSAPGLWSDMVLGVHYGIGPLMLLLFVAWVRLVGGPERPRRSDSGALPTMADRARP
jgi:hypothetical protein